MDLLVPLLIIAPLGFMSLGLLARRGGEHLAALRNVLFSAFALRLLAAVVFSLWPEMRLFHEDATGYEYVGMNLARYWHGDGPPLLIAADQNRGYYNVCAAIYYALGNFQVAASLVNAWVGSVNVFLVFVLARRFFHPAVCMRAAKYAAFFPSMILWSAIAIKDPLVTLLILVALIACIRLKERFSLGALLLTAAPLALVQPLRFYIVYFLGFAVIASMFIERGRNLAAGVPKMILVAGGAAALLVLAGFAGSAQAGVEQLSFERASAFRQGMASTAHSGFAADVDVSTPGAAIAFLPLGLSTLLFAPFPWQMTSLRSLLAAPETIFWWTMFPAVIRGLRYAMRRRFAATSPILIFSAILSVAYSFVHGNVGSGFRQRAQIFVLLFIFASLGEYLVRCKRQGIDPNLLITPERG